jgi:hypothetical protein
MPLKFRFIFLLSFSLIPFWMFACNKFCIDTERRLLNTEPDSEEERVRAILNELFETAGIYHSRLGKPEIELSEDVNLKIAQYHPRSNKILISSKVIEYASSKSAQSRDHIYLNIIGHELGHYFERILAMSTSSKSKESLCHQDSLSEINADFYGIFTAMLAGHSIIKNEVDEIIGAMYDLFDLNDDLNCYPPKVHRQKVAQRAIEKADSLYQLFQFANYLTAAEEYDAAIGIYDYLLGFYKGAEFYNNRGILYTLNGIAENYGNSGRYKRYFYPLELDVESKLSIIKDNGIILERFDDSDFLLGQADFQKAIINGGQQERYYLNEVVTMILLRKFQEARELLENRCTSDGDIEFLLNAIIKARTGKSKEAKADFKTLSKKEGSSVQLLAKNNLSILAALFKSSQSFESKIKENIPDILFYAQRDELNRISVFSIPGHHGYQFGWTNIPGKGFCLVLKKNNRLQLYVQELPSDFPILSLPDYLPSSMGLNFLSYSFETSYDKVKIIILQNGKRVVLR